MVMQRSGISYCTLSIGSTCCHIVSPFYVMNQAFGLQVILLMVPNHALKVKKRFSTNHFSTHTQKHYVCIQILVVFSSSASVDRVRCQPYASTSMLILQLSKPAHLSLSLPVSISFDNQTSLKRWMSASNENTLDISPFFYNLTRSYHS